MYMSPLHATQKFNKMLVHPAFPSSLSLVLVMCISFFWGGVDGELGGGGGREAAKFRLSQASKELHCAPFPRHRMPTF